MVNIKLENNCCIHTYPMPYQIGVKLKKLKGLWKNLKSTLLLLKNVIET